MSQSISCFNLSFPGSPLYNRSSFRGTFRRRPKSGLQVCSYQLCGPAVFCHGGAKNSLYTAAFSHDCPDGSLWRRMGHKEQKHQESSCFFRGGHLLCGRVFRFSSLAENPGGPEPAEERHVFTGACC